VVVSGETDRATLDRVLEGVTLPAGVVNTPKSDGD
jgi:hypothetical protein